MDEPLSTCIQAICQQHTNGPVVAIFNFNRRGPAPGSHVPEMPAGFQGVGAATIPHLFPVNGRPAPANENIGATAAPAVNANGGDLMQGPTENEPMAESPTVPVRAGDAPEGSADVEAVTRNALLKAFYKQHMGICTESSIVAPSKEDFLAPMPNGMEADSLTSEQLEAIFKKIEEAPTTEAKFWQDENQGLNRLDVYAIMVGSNGEVIYSGLTTLAQNTCDGPFFMARKPFGLPSKATSGIASETNLVLVDELCAGERIPTLLVMPEKFYKSVDMFDPVTPGRRRMRAKTILFNCRAPKKLSQKQLKVILPGMEVKLYKRSELPAVVEPAPTIGEVVPAVPAAANTEQPEVPNHPKPQPQASAPSGAINVLASQEPVHSNPVEQTGENGAAMEVDVGGDGDGDTPTPKFNTAIAVGPEFSLPPPPQPVRSSYGLDQTDAHIAFGSPIEPHFGCGTGDISTTSAAAMEEMEKELEAPLEEDHVVCVTTEETATLSNLDAGNGDAIPTTGAQAEVKAASGIPASPRPPADAPIFKQAGFGVQRKPSQNTKRTAGSSPSAVQRQPGQQKLPAHIGTNSGAGTSVAQRVLPTGGSGAAPAAAQQGALKSTPSGPKTKRIGDLGSGFVAAGMAISRDRHIESVSRENDRVRKENEALKKTVEQNAIAMRRKDTIIATLNSKLPEKERICNDDGLNQKRKRQELGSMDHYAKRQC